MVRPIIAAVDDMFFASKIRATAESLDIVVKFARSNDAVVASAQLEHPSLIIVDLHSQKIRPIELALQLKSSEGFRSLRLLGFFSHVDTEVLRQAREAGYDEVLPRSAFSANLSTILQREQQ